MDANLPAHLEQGELPLRAEPRHADPHQPQGACPLAEAVGRARAALAARADEVDLLNVFPVADGDTGVNMLRTATAVDEAARAALMGAQGNSGMILSQLVRGAAEALTGGGEVDGAVSYTHLTLPTN